MWMEESEPFTVINLNFVTLASYELVYLHFALSKEKELKKKIYEKSKNGTNRNNSLLIDAYSKALEQRDWP